MKNIFLAILIVFYGGSNLLAAIPNWSVNPADYSGSMVMVGVMSFDGVESLDGNDIVGAFIGTEVRGVANLQYEAAADRYIAYLIIYGNTSGGTITFKMYDADQDVEINALNNATFQVNGSQGNLGSPFLWSDVVARDASELLSFGFEGSVSEEIIGTDVNIIIPNQMELSALVGVFTISPGASLWLGNVPQVSGNSVNDFSDAVELKVIAENGTDFTNYSINVTQSVNPSPTDIEVAFGNTIENNAIDDVMATLSAVDDAEDSHFFSLVSGSGDSHNSLFEISNNQVLAKAVFDFESRSTYAIRIQVTDSDNQTFAKSVEVTITDVNESPSLTGAAYSLPENSAVGVLVTTLIATDPEGDVLEFSLIGGNGAFSLDTNTGDLKVASEGLLDFETTPQFVLTATVSDGSLSSTSEIIVNLTDVVENTRNTAPVVSDVTFSITENSVNNFFVGTIDATDAEGNRLTYAITAGNDLGGFSIGAASGVLLVADQTVLDFETNADFTLTVEVSDGELTSTATVAINLTDVDENVNQAPIIANQTFTVNEHSVVGFVIGTVAANDPNGDLLSYSLAEASSVIFLHQGSGQLSVLDPTALDFET